MSDLRCLFGIHSFPWPPHRYPSNLWEDFDVECERGCGARTTLTCIGRRDHWRDKHQGLSGESE